MSTPSRSYPQLSSETRRATEAATEDDRIWFEQHPGEDERCRPPFPHEFDFTGETCVSVRVSQIRPGMRARFPELVAQATFQ
jgi:hypothetical protein